MRKLLDFTTTEFVFTLVGVLVIGVLAGYGLGMHPLVLRDLFSSQAAAAWLQAVGSLVGIGVAIYVPWVQHQREQIAQQQRLAQRTRGLMALALPALEEWKLRLERVLKRLQSFPFDGPLHAKGQAAKVHNVALAPDRLVELLDRMALDGQVENFLGLLSVVSRLHFEALCFRENELNANVDLEYHRERFVADLSVARRELDVLILAIQNEQISVGSVSAVLG